MNESERIAGILRDAKEAVEAAGIEDDALRQIAFREAIALAAGQIPGTSPSGATTGQANTPDTWRSSGNPADVTDPIASIAKRLGVPTEEIDRVFHVEGDNLELTIAVAALASSKRTATREIAILVTAGRQASRLDERETDADAVRLVCSHYKKLDSPNFSSTIRELNGVLTVREKGRKKYLKMTQPAWEEASALVKRVLGAGD